MAIKFYSFITKGSTINLYFDVKFDSLFSGLFENIGISAAGVSGRYLFLRKFLINGKIKDILQYQNLK